MAAPGARRSDWAPSSSAKCRSTSSSARPPTRAARSSWRIPRRGEEGGGIEESGLQVPLRIKVEGRVQAREPAGQARALGIDARARLVRVEHLGIAAIGLLGILAQQRENALRLRARE